MSLTLSLSSSFFSFHRAHLDSKANLESLAAEETLVLLVDLDPVVPLGCLEILEDQEPREILDLLDLL